MCHIQRRFHASFSISATFHISISSISIVCCYEWLKKAFFYNSKRLFYKLRNLRFLQVNQSCIFNSWNVLLFCSRPVFVQIAVSTNLHSRVFIRNGWIIICILHFLINWINYCDEKYTSFTWSDVFILTCFQLFYSWFNSICICVNSHMFQSFQVKFIAFGEFFVIFIDKKCFETKFT